MHKTMHSHKSIGIRLSSTHSDCFDCVGLFFKPVDNTMFLYCLHWIRFSKLNGTLIQYTIFFKETIVNGGGKKHFFRYFFLCNFIMSLYVFILCFNSPHSSTKSKNSLDALYKLIVINKQINKLLL